MKFKPYKINPLNEALINRPLEGQDEIDVVASVPITYADAVNQRIKTDKKMEDDFKEPKKNVEDFLKVNHDKDQKPKSTPELKKMKLSEAVEYGNPMEFGIGPCAPTIVDVRDSIQDAVSYLGDAENNELATQQLRTLVKRLMYDKQKVENFNAYWTERYPAAIEYIDKQIALIPNDTLRDILRTDDLEELFDANISLDASGQSVGLLGGTGGSVTNEELDEILDLNVGVDATGQSVGILNGQGGQVTNEDVRNALEDDDDLDGLQEFVDFKLPKVPKIQTEDVDPHFFQLEEEPLNESPVAVAEPETKKRTRSSNEEKDPWDYSSEDIWYAVYDELSATVDNEGKGQQVDKQIKARRGERYEHVYPHGEKDIIVYAKSPEEFNFARKVADHYGVTCEEPKRDENKNSNGFYKYSMVINMPDLF